MVYGPFPPLEGRRKQIAGTLSGGEQQMLAMGRALMSHPKLLMLDEPSMGLAPILVDQIFDIIKDLHKAGTTILLVEQNASKALEIADRVPEPLVLGRHLIQRGLKPGKEFKPLLDKCFEAQLEGLFATEKGAMEFLDKLLCGK